MLPSNANSSVKFQDLFQRKLMQKHYKSISYVLLIFAACCWVATPLIPFLTLETTTKTILITGVVVAGEVAFVGSMLLGGKAIWEKIKAYFKKIFRKSASSETENQPEEEL
jgi:FtsH-binding integral membrane protein